jgi:formate hydrogenlyase subunit 3/multisubunit Na+/H+ antiporter MnhD subunit
MDAIPWVIGCVTVPILGALVAFVARERWVASVGGLTSVLVTACAGMLVWQTSRVGAFDYPVGGWGAPLGIELSVDGLSVLMVAMTSVVGFFVSVYAWSYFSPSSEPGPGPSQAVEAHAHHLQEHKRRYFWPLWLLLWGGLHALFVSSDIFNLYVTLEVVGLSAVSLVAVAGEKASGAAMRYLLVTLVGSMLYLLGVGVLYATYSTVDIDLLSRQVVSGASAWTALGLMAAGLVLKTALFPAHFWLPGAHSSAPSPVSALLSGLVVTSSFYLLVRLWLDVFGAVVVLDVALVLASLGLFAIVWGSVQALLQSRLKLLVAYSTVAQLGYLFIIFAPAVAGGEAAWRGGILYALSHACAKAAMFMAAGSFVYALGDDEIDALCGTGQRLFWTFAAFSLAGITLMGLPPSGGFVGKWLIARAAIEAEQWVIVVAVFLGGLLTAGYVFKVVQMAFVSAPETSTTQVRALPLPMQWAPMSLALAAIVLGFWAHEPLALLEVGNPFGDMYEAALGATNAARGMP